MATALAITPLPPAVSTSPWVPPIGPPTRIVRAFDRPSPNWLPGHRGVDLAAVAGQSVKAAGPGRIVWSGPIVGRGVVVISHANGLRTTYEPVRGSVSVGQAVLAGEVIGAVEGGQSHCGGPVWCVHWGLRRGREYLNPLLVLKGGRPRLIPVVAAGSPSLQTRWTASNPRRPIEPAVEARPWCASGRSEIRSRRAPDQFRPA